MSLGLGAKGWGGGGKQPKSIYQCMEVSMATLTQPTTKAPNTLR